LEQNLCVLIDFENVAAGTEKEGHGRFDIRLVMRRLKDKGRILVARSYGDWGRFAKFKQSLLEQGITMVELTSYRGQDKNRADIAMVVDAMELAFTRAYLDTFVILSGDSDFSPLVSKLRENAKTVIGVGVKNSSSDLLIANCDEFIYYDDLVREDEAKRRAARKRKESRPASAVKESAPSEDKRQEALDLALETVHALIAERGEDERIWGSMVKQALKRRNPGFNESYYGFRAFSDLLEEAEKRGLLALERDDKSGGYIIRRAAA